MKLTDAQFEAAQGKVDSLVRGTKRGTPERAAAELVSADWEQSLALPQVTASQRQARYAAIAASAERLGLL